MNWDDETYVKVYTRDTLNWLALSFIAKGLFLQLLRKVDRTGVLPLGRLGKKAVAVAIGHPGDWPRLEAALEELLADRCVEIHRDVLVIPNFIAAQQARMSGSLRTKVWREKKKQAAIRGDETSTVCDETSAIGDVASQSVTRVTEPVTLRVDETRSDKKEEPETQPPPSAPAAQVAKRKIKRDPSGPAGEAFRYWREVIWPKLSDLPYPTDRKKDHVQVALALKTYDVATIKACLDQVPGDPYWRKQDLAAVCAGIPKLLPRKASGDAFRYGEIGDAP
jgi:hypothetical protein